MTEQERLDVTLSYLHDYKSIINRKIYKYNEQEKYYSEGTNVIGNIDKVIDARNYATILNEKIDALDTVISLIKSQKYLGL